MLFCPKCKCEYENWAPRCSDCLLELVDELELPDTNETPEVNYEFITDDVPDFLTMEDGIKADIAISLLKSNGIPVLQKRRLLGDYLRIYMGFSFQEVDIFVPSKLLERANEILSAKPVPDQDYNFDSDDDFIKHEKEESRKRRIVAGIILLLAFAPVLFGFPGL